MKEIMKRNYLTPRLVAHLHLNKTLIICQGFLANAKKHFLRDGGR